MSDPPKSQSSSWNVEEHQGGGFISSDLPPSSVLSPTPSSTTSTAATKTNTPLLPRTRTKPLPSGSAKETDFILHMDQSLTNVSRRHALRLDEWAQKHEPEAGYTTFAQAAKDLDSLIDLVWISGTPTLQIGYLLNVAFLISSFLPSFPPAPKPTFHLLKKLDLALASLLEGQNVETGATLSGFGIGGSSASGRAIFSVTEKVRLKSIIDQTRLVVVKVMEDVIPDPDDDEDDDDEILTGMDDDDDDDDDDTTGLEVDISRVYDKTETRLGEILGGTPIGIVTDE